RRFEPILVRTFFFPFSLAQPSNSLS
ncbi:hypothetical protein ACN38_g7044, partial [Penicillium nordicum]